MFVSTARVRLVGMPDRDKKKKEFYRQKRAARRNLKFRDLLRMPCLLPTCASCLVGFFVLMGGTAMSIVAYHPAFVDPYVSRHNETLNITSVHTLRAKYLHYALHRPTAMKILSYVGPMFMGCGLFTMMVAGVLYCEFVDKYVNISTEKHRNLTRKALYEIIIDQLRKNYFRGLEIPTTSSKVINVAPEVKPTTLSRCLSISSPVLCLVSDKDTDTQKEEVKQAVIQSPIKHKTRLEVLQRENWIKTTSLPTMKPESASEDKLNAMCSSTEKYLMTKRLSKSCGNVVDMFSTFGSHSSRVASSGFDNLAYTPDLDVVQTTASCDTVSRMTSQEASCGNLSSDAYSRLCSDLDKSLNIDALVDVDNSFDDDNCSSKTNEEIFSNDCDASKTKGKHASVIIHKAYVHQPADACDINNMQISNVKRVCGLPENTNGDDDGNDPDVVQHKGLLDDDGDDEDDDVSKPSVSNHVTIHFDDDTSNWSDCMSQSDGDEGDSLDMCESVLL